MLSQMDLTTTVQHGKKEIPWVVSFRLEEYNSLIDFLLKWGAQLNTRNKEGESLRDRLLDQDTFWNSVFQDLKPNSE